MGFDLATLRQSRYVERMANPIQFFRACCVVTYFAVMIGVFIADMIYTHNEYLPCKHDPTRECDHERSIVLALIWTELTMFVFPPVAFIIIFCVIWPAVSICSHFCNCQDKADYCMEFVDEVIFG